MRQNVDISNPSFRLESSAPTDSKLFEGLQSHFPDIKTAWDDFEKKIGLFGEQAATFYQSIENSLSKECTKDLERLNKVLNMDVTHYICQEFKGRLLDPESEKAPLDVVSFERRGEQWLIRVPRNSTLLPKGDTESLTTAERIRDHLQSLANNESLRKQATKITHDYGALVTDSDKLEDMIRDAMARSKLEGKCKYCP